jgi:hypothetical protein
VLDLSRDVELFAFFGKARGKAKQLFVGLLAVRRRSFEKLNLGHSVIIVAYLSGGCATRPLSRFRFLTRSRFILDFGAHDRRIPDHLFDFGIFGRLSTGCGSRNGATAFGYDGLSGDSCAF